MSPSIQAARIRRTQLWVDDPALFYAQLTVDLDRAARAAERAGLKLAVRLNTFSDVAWELHAPEIFKRFSDAQFYDYTKRPARMTSFLGGALPSNYHLVFSASEKSSAATLHSILERGGSIVVVSRDPDWPGRFERPHVDGDEHDLTFLHPPGSVIVLRPKGPAIKKRTRFIP